jgi:hypothetical protein
MAKLLRYHQILKCLSTWSPLSVNVLLTKRNEPHDGHQVEISLNIEAFIDLVATKCKCISNKKEQITLCHQVEIPPNIKELLTWWPPNENVILTKRNEQPNGHKVQISQNIKDCIGMAATKLKYENSL